MAKKISQLTQATEVKSDDVTVIVQDGETKKLPLNMMVTKQDIENKKIAGLAKLDEIEATYENDTYTPTITVKNKSSVKVGEGDGVDYSANVMDGPAKSAILSGQTLVNISKIVGSIDRAPGRALSLGNGIVKSNATYMIMFNLDVINDISKIKIEAGKDGLWVSDISMNVATLGINKFIVSTPDKDINEIKITNPQQSSTSITMTNIMLFEYQDNMENWNIPYFEDMASCKMPVLSTCGKNLFNINKEPLAAYGVKYSIDNDEIIVNSNGEIGYQNIAFTLDKILLGKTIYTSYELVEHTSDNWHMQFVYTNINGTTIYTSGKSGKITFPNEIIGDLKLSILPCNSSTTGVSHTLKIKNIQIEENSVATAYEPHKTNILTVNEDVTLRSNGDICDELNLLTGQLTQRIDEDGEVLSQEVVKTVDLMPSGTHPSTTPYCWKNGHIQLSSSGLLPNLEYSVVTSRAGQINQNAAMIVKNDKRIFDLEILLAGGLVNTTYQALTLQNQVETGLSKVSLNSETEPDYLLYHMIMKLIEEKAYKLDDLTEKVSVFYLYEKLSDEQFETIYSALYPFVEDEIVEEPVVEELPEVVEDEVIM